MSDEAITVEVADSSKASRSIAKRISQAGGGVLLFIAAVAPPLHAQEPAPDPKALGLTEATFSYCAKVDPASAARYQEKIKAVAQGASEEILAKLRQTDDYQRAHAAVDDFVAKVDEHNAKKVCGDAPAPKK